MPCLRLSNCSKIKIHDISSFPPSSNPPTLIGAARTAPRSAIPSPTRRRWAIPGAAPTVKTSANSVKTRQPQPQPQRRTRKMSPLAKSTTPSWDTPTVRCLPPDPWTVAWTATRRIIHWARRPPPRHWRQRIGSLPPRRDPSTQVHLRLNSQITSGTSGGRNPKISPPSSDLFYYKYSLKSLPQNKLLI